VFNSHIKLKTESTQQNPKILATPIAKITLIGVQIAKIQATPKIGIGCCILISDQKEEQRRGKEIGRKRKKRRPPQRKEKWGAKELSRREKKKGLIKETDHLHLVRKSRPQFRERL
jgi:hypothetical protein